MIYFWNWGFFFVRSGIEICIVSVDISVSFCVDWGEEEGEGGVNIVYLAGRATELEIVSDWVVFKNSLR